MKPPMARKTLADYVMEKFAEMEGVGGNVQVAPTSNINPKIVHVYTQCVQFIFRLIFSCVRRVGLLLSRYRSGKLPKAFKIIPTLSNWESIIELTQPDNWTPHAMYQATRIFSSNLKMKMAQRFYNLILLERVRTDIANSQQKVNIHLYAALKKALYKPAAWFKGILLPLCESGCTLKEAVIFSSILSKVTVPVLHSSAVLLKLAELEYTGASSIFIRVLLDKKYALPFRVVDALVHHFLQFKRDERKMPVLWHQSLLVFAQRYKSDLTPEQKTALLELLSHQTHYDISPEIRRERKCFGIL